MKTGYVSLESHSVQAGVVLFQTTNFRRSIKDILVFSKLPKLKLLAFCVTSNGNRLEIVTNQINLNTNLDYSRTY